MSSPRPKIWFYHAAIAIFTALVYLYNLYLVFVLIVEKQILYVHIPFIPKGSIIIGDLLQRVNQIGIALLSVMVFIFLIKACRNPIFCSLIYHALGAICFLYLLACGYLMAYQAEFKYLAGFPLLAYGCGIFNAFIFIILLKKSYPQDV